MELEKLKVRLTELEAAKERGLAELNLLVGRIEEVKFIISEMEKPVVEAAADGK